MFIPYDMDTDAKLREIFREHCNLSMEQYEEIRGELIFLITDIQDGETMHYIEGKYNKLNVIFEFLYNTKELTLYEYNELCNLMETIREDAEKLRAWEAET